MTGRTGRRLGSLQDLASLAKALRDAAADAVRRDAETRERAALEKSER